MPEVNMTTFEQLLTQQRNQLQTAIQKAEVEIIANRAVLDCQIRELKILDSQLLSSTTVWKVRDDRQRNWDRMYYLRGTGRAVSRKLQGMAVSVYSRFDVCKAVFIDCKEDSEVHAPVTTGLALLDQQVASPTTVWTVKISVAGGACQEYKLRGTAHAIAKRLEGMGEVVSYSIGEDWVIDCLEE